MALLDSLTSARRENVFHNSPAWLGNTACIKVRCGKGSCLKTLHWVNAFILIPLDSYLNVFLLLLLSLSLFLNSFAVYQKQSKW